MSASRTFPPRDRDDCPPRSHAPHKEVELVPVAPRIASVHRLTASSWQRNLGWLLVALAGLAFAGRIYYTLCLFAASAGIAYLLYPWADWLYDGGRAVKHRPLSWTTSVLLVYLLVPLVLLAVWMFSAPLLTAQINTISTNLPQQAERVQSLATYWQGRFDRAHMPLAVRQHVQNLIALGVSRLGTWVAQAVEQMANLVMFLLWVGGFLATALIISVVMLLNAPSLMGEFQVSVPEEYRDEVAQLLREIHVIFGGFLKGTALLSLTSASGVYLGLSALWLVPFVGMERSNPMQYALVLAALALLMYPIPLLGVAAMALVSSFLAYLQGGTITYVLTVALICSAVPLCVDRFLSPRLLSRAMGVSPLFIMFAVAAGAEWMGFWGMLLGVPVAAAFKVLFRWVRVRFLSGAETTMEAALGRREHEERLLKVSRSHVLFRGAQASPAGYGGTQASPAPYVGTQQAPAGGGEGVDLALLNEDAGALGRPAEEGAG
jgi:putative permease